jgi:hypothetical protein
MKKVWQPYQQLIRAFFSLGSAEDNSTIRCGFVMTLFSQRKLPAWKANVFMQKSYNLGIHFV